MARIESSANRYRRSVSRRTVGLATLGVLTLGLAACSGDDTAASSAALTSSEAAQTSAAASETTAAAEASDGAGGARIEIKDFAFGEPLTVPVGTEVSVINLDGASHTWTSPAGGFNSGGLARDETFSHTFTEAGSFGFVCDIHPTMTGSITVT